MFYMFFPGGGIGRYTDHLASSLVKTNTISPEVACSPQFEYRAKADYPTWPNLSSISAKNPLVRKAKFLRSQFTSPRLALRHARETKTQVIHFSNINHLSYATWRSQALAGPFRIVATAHDVRRAKAIVSRAWETKWLIQFYRDCKALFVHSEEQKQELLDFSGVIPDAIHVIPHGIYEYPNPTASRLDLRRKYNIPIETPVGLFFGDIREDKNLDNLLQAAAIAKCQPYLLVAGRPQAGLTSRKLKERIVELKIDKRVKLIDRFIPEEDVGDLFELSDFVALTYKKTFTSQSGVLNIAAHYRRTVLVTTASTLYETVSRFGIGTCCLGDDPKSIAMGLQKVVCQSGVEKAFEDYREYHDWFQIAKTTAKVYSRVCDE